MAKILKLLWRLDHEYSYALLDKKGAVLRTLFTEVKGYWQNASTGALPESLVANFVSAAETRAMSVEPTSCNGSLEWPLGQDLERFLTHDSFRNLSRILEKILNLCEVRGVLRAGIRFILVERADISAGFRDRFARQTSNFYVRCSEEVLGQITDTAIVLEGKHDDGIGYRLLLGLTAEKNILQNSLGIRASDLSELLTHQLFFDIDLYEQSISFREHSLQRWATTKVDKIVRLVREFRSAADSE
jgi:hypothetical protein